MNGDVRDERDYWRVDEVLENYPRGSHVVLVLTRGEDTYEYGVSFSDAYEIGSALREASEGVERHEVRLQARGQDR